MAHSSLLEFLPCNELEQNFKKSDLEDEKIANRLKLIRQWLDCEDHLPTNIDEDLLKNFVCGCKANLEKTKAKLEKYLIAKSKMTHFFSSRGIIPEEHNIYPHYRCFYASRKQSRSGNRVIVLRLPSQDTNGFDFSKLSKYMTLGFDILLYKDKSVKYDFIYDAVHFTGPMLAKMNLTVVKSIFQVLYNIMPYRINSICVINTTPGFDIFMNIAKPLTPKKIKDRIKTVKASDLPKILPPECVPEDYGGKAEKLNDRNYEIFEYLKTNRNWCKETESLQLSGPLPHNEKDLYSFEEFCMDGCFRKLTID